MPLSRLRRRALAVTTASLMVLGGSLLAAAPANAATAPFAVTSPTDGSSVETRSFDVTGTGTDGAAVTVVTEYTTELADITAVSVESGSFTVPVTFPEDAPVSQTISVIYAEPEAVLPETIELTVTLPAAESGTDTDTETDPGTDTGTDTDPGTNPDTDTDSGSDPGTVAPVGAIEITSPTEGSTATSRTVTYTGTAPAGSQIIATTEYPIIGDLALGPIPVDESGAFEFIIPFAPNTENPVTVTFTGTTAEAEALEPVTVSIDLPDPVAAPVITAPSVPTIAGPTVTFAGTGIAGNGIALVIAPTDEASLAALANVDPLSLAEPIIVAADGTWTVTYELALGNFAVTAIHTSNPNESLIPEILSLPSTPVEFSLVEPVVTTVPAGSMSDGTPVLAETGFEQSGLLSTAALVLLLGGALLFAGRRQALLATRN